MEAGDAQPQTGMPPIYHPGAQPGAQTAPQTKAPAPTPAPDHTTTHRKKKKVLRTKATLHQGTIAPQGEGLIHRPTVRSVPQGPATDKGPDTPQSILASMNAEDEDQKSFVEMLKGEIEVLKGLEAELDQLLEDNFQ